MTSFKLVLSFLNYWFSASTKHSVHSPFVYTLLTQCIHPDVKISLFKDIERLRQKMMDDNTTITVHDMGAGIEGRIYSERRISAIAKNSAKAPRYARLLYRITNYFKPEYMIELGTSTGISALYEAAGNTHGKLITIEGCKETAAIARQNFGLQKAKNIALINDSFEKALPEVLNTIPKLDYLFIDGHHRKEATLNYFNLALTKAHHQTVVVIDDINWSKEMQEAWAVIKNHNKVTATVDLFMIGLVFLNPELSKESFVLRY